MIQAIVYTSQAGTTKEYAELLSKATGLPAYASSDAERALARDTEIIYMGWLMASAVKGLKKAQARYTVALVCAVGMGATGSQLAEVRKANGLPEGMPVFTLQGGFDISKLHGIYKFMMRAMRATVGKKLAGKQDMTPEEKDMLDMLTNGASRVSNENLADVLKWCEENAIQKR